MSRNISLNALTAVNASETDEVFLILLTIDHPDLTAPIRISSDAVDTVSRGETFVAFPFDLTLPTDEGENAPRAKIEIDNIDRQIIQAVRNITSPATVLIEVVRAAAPDTVEISMPDFTLKNVEYNALSVTGDLTLEDLFQEPYPARLFSPADFPGLF